MTVTVTTSYSGPFTPNGVATAFAFDFKAASTGEVAVEVGGVAISPALYSVTLSNGSDGGTVHFSTAPSAASGSFHIVSAPSFQQQGGFTGGERPFTPASVNALFDRAAVRDIALKDAVGRAIQVPVGESGGVLPASNDRAGKFLAFDADGNPVHATGTGADEALRSDLGANGGTVLLGFDGRSVDAKLRETISVKDARFAGGAKGDGTTDDTAAVKAAFAYAKGLSIVDASSESYGYVLKGGTTVYFPSGCYVVSDTIEFSLNVSIEGDGMNSSIIKSSVNGQILRNDPVATVAGSYNREGSALRNFGIIGDPTKPLQDGLSLLRWISSPIDNVSVSRCGRDAVVMRECTAGVVNNLRVSENVGKGLCIQLGMVGSWGTADNELPSNGMTFNVFRAISNGGPGIALENVCNGIVFNDSFVEYNNGGGTVNDGYQTVVQTGSYVPIIFNRLWSEGDHLAAHIYVGPGNALVEINSWRHFAHGALVDRALVAQGGTIDIHNPWAAQNAYPTINGSNAPFRINHDQVSIGIYNAKGAVVSGIGLVEKMDGSKLGLDNSLRQVGRDAIYGNDRHFTGFGAVSAMEFLTDTEQVHPYFRVEPFRRALAFGSGGAVPDTFLKRLGVGVLGMDTSRGPQLFDAGGAWDGNHLRMGAYHFWVDATGALRQKNGAPTSDTDGAIV